MGGYGAIKFLLKYPELFSSGVAFAGSFRTADELVEMDEGKVFNTMFAGDAARFDAQHPSTLLRKASERQRRKLNIHLYMGTDDKPVLLAAHRRFHALLKELKVPHGYTEYDGINHNLPKLAAAVKTEALQFAVTHFGGGANPPAAE